MEVIISGCIGYVFGCLSPAALISKWKDTDLRTHGTGNLGATNTMLVLGLRFGLLVMVFDALKAVLAMNLIRHLFPGHSYAPLLGGLFAAVGHMFPFYMDFRGGKGLAAFAGTILAYDRGIFFALLVLCILLMLITNHTAIVPISSSIIFTILSTLKSRSISVFAITSLFSIVIIYRHRDNIQRIFDGNDADVRGYLREHLFR